MSSSFQRKNNNTLEQQRQPPANAIIRDDVAATARDLSFSLLVDEEMGAAGPWI